MHRCKQWNEWWLKILFSYFSFSKVIFCMLPRCHGLLGHRTEPLLMLLVTPVLFLLRQVIRCAVKNAYMLNSSDWRIQKSSMGILENDQEKSAFVTRQTMQKDMKYESMKKKVFDSWLWCFFLMLLLHQQPLHFLVFIYINKQTALSCSSSMKGPGWGGGHG